jgi:choloylglycine hydrolase
MYFDSATSPNVFWLPLDALAFDAGSPVRRLALKGGQTYSGDATAGLEAAEPFVFLPAKPH